MTLRTNRPRGFALIELMVVIVILTILMVMIMPQYVVARSRGRLSACESNLRNLATAIEVYATEHNHQVPSSLDDLVPQFVAAIPRCPSAGTPDAYRDGYASVQVPEAAYTVSCSGAFHVDLGVPAGHPLYTYGVGLTEH